MLAALRQQRLFTARGDVLAGLVVPPALIPEAIAFSIIAGVDPKVRPDASLCIAAVSVLTRGRPPMISAASGAAALVMVSACNILLAATLFIGVLQIVAGAFTLGVLMRFVSPVRTRGRLLLEQARQRAKRQGIEAMASLRKGRGVDTLLKLDSGVRLFVIGKRGERAEFANGHLGSGLERVIRAVPRPVLAPPRTLNRLARFMIAYDGSAATSKCFEVVCARPLSRRLACDLLLVDEGSDVNRGHMERARLRLRESGFDPLAPYVDCSHVLRSCHLPLLLLR